MLSQRALKVSAPDPGFGEGGGGVAVPTLGKVEDAVRCMLPLPVPGKVIN